MHDLFLDTKYVKVIDSAAVLQYNEPSMEMEIFNEKPSISIIGTENAITLI